MPRTKKLTDDEVLDSVLKVMVDNGPTFTLSDAADESGIAPSTLIQRFGGKDDLIRRVLERDNQRFKEWLNDSPVEVGEDAVIEFIVSMTPGIDDEDTLPQHLLWLREDFSNPLLNQLTRDRFAMIYDAIAERLPPLSLPKQKAVQLLDAQRQGAMIQWGIFREGHMQEYVKSQLKHWFSLADRNQSD